MGHKGAAPMFIPFRNFGWLVWIFPSLCRNLGRTKKKTKKRKRKRPSDNAMFKGLFCRRESLKLVKTQASSFPTRRTLLFKRGPLPFSGHILVGKVGYQLPLLTNESVSYWLPYVKIKWKGEEDRFLHRLWIPIPCKVWIENVFVLRERKAHARQLSSQKWEHHEILND